MYDVSVIDIGNTNVTTGYFLNSNLEKVQYNKTKYFTKRIKLLSAKRIVFVSVVPRASVEVFKKYPLAEELKLENLKDIFFPENIGIDRAVNCITSMTLYKTNNVLVIDFGTALTFTCCFEKKFQGGLIMPGFGVAKDSLLKKTASLSFNGIAENKGIFQIQTSEAISSGLLNLYVRALNSLIDDYRKKCKEELVVVMTGGDSLFFSSFCDNYDVVNPTLLLEGMFLISN